MNNPLLDRFDAEIDKVFGIDGRQSVEAILADLKDQGAAAAAAWLEDHPPPDGRRFGPECREHNKLGYAASQFEVAKRDLSGRWRSAFIEGWLATTRGARQAAGSAGKG